MSARARRRIPTQPVDYDWPFLYSVVPGRGLVQNIRVPRARKRIDITKKELKK